MVAIASLAWVAILQVQITDLRNDSLAASDRAARIDRVVSVLASDRLAIKPLQPAAGDLVGDAVDHFRSAVANRAQRRQQRDLVRAAPCRYFFRMYGHRTNFLPSRV